LTFGGGAVPMPLRPLLWCSMRFLRSLFAATSGTRSVVVVVVVVSAVAVGACAGGAGGHIPSRPLLRWSIEADAISKSSYNRKAQVGLDYTPVREEAD
jgi:hypothetical protein